MADRPVGRLQVVSLVGALVIAGVVGVWAYGFPRAFYDRFPLVLGSWISSDGPYNEHLVRDHGAQYLALGLASATALRWRSGALYRVLGTAWGSFGVLHLAYHVTHLGHLPPGEAVAQVVVLVVAAVLGAGVAVPPRGPRPGAPSAHNAHDHGAARGKRP